MVVPTTRVADSVPLILTVDDDPDLAAIVRTYIEDWGYAAESVGSAAALWDFLGRRVPVAMLMDVMLGDADGSQLIAEVRQKLPELPIIMITRSKSIEAAVRCMKQGATDYITKPIDFEQLEQSVRNAVELGRLSHQMKASSDARPRRRFHDLVGQSEPMQRLYDLVANVGAAEVSALILGETGTGKELVAQAIHKISGRRDGPLIAVNTAAIPRDLVESELFGHEKGAFTGATRQHIGTCEQADRGTLFLDEIGEMELDIQAKMLRFLQDHVVRRVGSGTTRKVDVRVLAASNRDPSQQIADGKLREDLYYRLRVVSLALPPLRDRSGDVSLLATHFLKLSAARHGREFVRISPQALDCLERYHWPGNVRELKNVIEEAVVLNDGKDLTIDMIPSELVEGVAYPATGIGPPGDDQASSRTTQMPGAASRLSARELAERRSIEHALTRADGNAEAAARLLDVSRATIYRKIKKYGLAHT